MSDRFKDVLSNYSTSNTPLQLRTVCGSEYACLIVGVYNDYIIIETRSDQPASSPKIVFIPLAAISGIVE
jgi:hypothetical protein